MSARSVGLAVAVVTAWLLLVLALTLVGSLVDFGLEGSAGVRRFANAITLLAASAMIALAVILLAAGIDEHARGEPQAAFYAPLLANKLALAAVLFVVALYAVAGLHGLMGRWRWLMDPEAGLVVQLYFVAVVGASGWQAVVVLRGMRLSWRAVALVAALVVAVPVLLIVVPL